MSQEDSKIVLDFPEEEKKPEPKLFPKFLMVGVILVMVASIVKIAGFRVVGLALFIVSWLTLVIHFALRLKSNFKFHKYMCLRDFGRLGVVTAIIMKLLDLPFVLPVMILSGMIYAGGYFGAWITHSNE